MNRKYVLIGFLLLSFILLTGCNSILNIFNKDLAKNSGANFAFDSQKVINFGDPNFQHLREKWQSLSDRNAKESLNIIQLGDSHTAADIMTGKFRELAQSALGDGGIGRITPMNIPRQRHSLVSYNSRGWELKVSHKEPNLDYPMGGYIAIPKKRTASLEIKLKPGVDSSNLLLSFLIKQNKQNSNLLMVDNSGNNKIIKPNTLNRWTFVNCEANFPIIIKTSTPNDIQFGGLWIKKSSGVGAIVTPIGMNGAMQKSWEQWGGFWQRELNMAKSDLVIISYGTNEAFSNFNPKSFEESLVKGIRQIRQAAPETAILIIGAPNSFKRDKNGNLAHPENLMAIKNLQKKIARQEKTLYWDWAASLGNFNNPQAYFNSGFVRPDFIHLTKAGYFKSAESLFYNLNKIMH